MKPLALTKLSEKLGCKLALDVAITEVCTDTRAIAPGCLFVALAGERFDGHDFAIQALAAGAAAVVVSRDVGTPPDRSIYVANTRSALIALGGVYRDQFQVRMAGITGSVGKTTTKEMMAAVFTSRYNTLKTEGNLNNEIGTPKTLFRLDDTTEAAVIEMGMSGFGEIEELSRAVKPDVGVVTWVGVSHIEALGSRENILKAKLEITAGMQDGATLLLCGDNDLLQDVCEPRLQVILYGIDNPKCQILAQKIVENSPQTDFEILYNGKGYAAAIPAVGKHNVRDALAAFGAGVTLGIAPEEAAAALANYAPSGMRQKIVKYHGVTVVEDCYNASPDSMRAAIGTLASMQCVGRRIAVLGDMLELGSISAAAHLDIGSFAAEQGIDALYAFGEGATGYVTGAKAKGLAALHFGSKTELGDFLAQTARPGDIIWFKASRGIQLEETIQRYYSCSHGAGQEV